MTDTFSLKLLYGIPPAVGDPLSAEQGMEVIALASEVMRPAGFFMDEERPFFPQIAGLKNGGAWLDNPAEDGRHLQSEAKGNIVETIYVKLAGDVTQRYHYLSALSRFADEARRFHSTDYQTRPVQIEWWASGAPGPQWALVYNIDYAVQRAHSDAGTVFDVVITVEREPAWRGVMFGLPATVWTQYALGNDPGSDYTYADLSLLDGTALVQETVQNRHEFDGAVGYDYGTPPLSKNWIDIDAADIPGDAPALVSVTATYHDIHRDGATSNQWSIKELFIARSTKPRSWQTRESDLRPQFYNLNAGDAQAITGSKIATANSYEGLFSNGSSAQRYFWRQPASAAVQSIGWGFSAAQYRLSFESFRGRFAVFIRGRTDTTSPASFEFRYANNTAISSNEITLTPAYTPSPTLATQTEGIMFYIGSFQFPLNVNSQISEDGTGIDILAITSALIRDFRFKLLVTTATATQTTEVFDVILLPFDEGQIRGVIQRINTNPEDLNDGSLIYDNTGYLTRENNETVRIFDVGIAANDPEFTGNRITLVPKSDNRLYFLFSRTNENNKSFAALEKDIDVRVNIIPRWYGIRDK